MHPMKTSTPRRDPKNSIPVLHQGHDIVLREALAPAECSQPFAGQAVQAIFSTEPDVPFFVFEDCVHEVVSNAVRIEFHQELSIHETAEPSISAGPDGSRSIFEDY